ncbi:heme peroxidase [Podospora aff. communis PSN243]|uniref:Peroxidase n=1 Tax=Podospora aff. communis PSN243 TaxID=3040156 RepID=A0AAV9GRW3_9PEZI|nr:heme peroxidase [Podospora aff. communis PSN243]
MKTTAVLSALIGSAVAHPGMGGAMEEIKNMVMKRQFQPSTAMLGDLITLPNSALSTTGAAIKAILQGTGNPIDTTTFYTAPAGGRDAQACRQDRCCIWKYIANDMRAAFFNAGTNECTNLARGAIRLGFHDAAAWSINHGNGGADGSIILSGTEMSRTENLAMVPIANQMTTWFNTYRNYGVSMADLIQMGAKIGAGSCPGGPRIRFFIGRTDNPNPAPTGLLPPPTFSAQQLIDNFGNKTIGPGGLVALLAAHTASKQQSSGLPQDTTPGKWDQKYFADTVDPSVPGLVRFPSDINVANGAVTAPIWNQFRNNKAAWDRAYAAEYIRMSLLGFASINGMFECTKVMPSVLV